MVTDAEDALLFRDGVSATRLMLSQPLKLMRELRVEVLPPDPSATTTAPPTNERTKTVTPAPAAPPSAPPSTPAVPRARPRARLRRSPYDFLKVNFDGRAHARLAHIEHLASRRFEVPVNDSIIVRAALELLGEALTKDLQALDAMSPTNEKAQLLAAHWQLTFRKAAGERNVAFTGLADIQRSVEAYGDHPSFNKLLSLRAREESRMPELPKHELEDYLNGVK